MKKHHFILIMAVLLLLPVSAQAFQQEYHTYGAHSAVVNAFNKTALIFSDASYTKLFSILATVSLTALICRFMWGLMAGGFKGDGSAVLFQGIAPWLITVAIFLGTVVPKGTLHIYDPTENKYQAIGGIPLIVVVIASVSNKLERIMVEAVQTSGDPLGFTAQAGGKGFLGLESLSNKKLETTDHSLAPSLNRYLDDCFRFQASLEPGLILETRRGTTDLQKHLGQGDEPGQFHDVIYC